MISEVTVRETPFQGIRSISKSSFLTNDGTKDNLSPFSFRDVLDIFKKKDSSVSTSSQSSTTVKKDGSGVGAGILTGLLSVVSVAGSLAPILPQIGIGSKSRIAETNAIANANTQVYNAQTQMILAEQEKEKEKESLYLIVGVGVLLLVIVMGVLFAKR